MLAFKLRHALLLTSLVFAANSHAASFDCAGASSPVEKAICADPYTSSLDEKLGVLWRTAVVQVADPKALKADQRSWLKQRNQCAANGSCLRREYLMRLKALEYVTKPFSWDATWQMIPWGVSSTSEVTTRRLDATHIAFDISASNGGNSGDMDGVAAIDGDVAHFDGGICTLKFSAFNGLLNVEPDGGNGACSGGMGVYYGGRYVASEQPIEIEYDLLSLGVVHTQQEDQTLRTLLKNDYQTLLQNSGSMATGENSSDVPEGEVNEFWLRGLATSNAAILMSAPGGRIWLVLLVFDEQRKVRARYYTNVPKWKTRVPDVLLAWRERLAGHATLPLDLMP